VTVSRSTKILTKSIILYQLKLLEQVLI